MNTIPKVCIIILNWNGKKDTIECLDSVRKIEYLNFKIILVDNASTDGSVEYIEKQYPEITIIQNKENMGFTGGNNVGIRKALQTDAKYFLLLNNDTIVDKNLITECVTEFQKNESVGIIGPKVVYYNNPENIWCAGCSYNEVIGRSVMYGTFSKKKDFEKEEIVDWISFCVVMIKREVVEKIGVLDDDFFSSYEDLDFCLRAKKAGYLCAYTPNTVVKHKIARDWGGLDNPVYIYYQVRNALLCMKKNRSAFGFFLYFMIFFCISIPKRSYKFIQQKKALNIIYEYMGFYDFMRGRHGKGVLSQKIIEQRAAKNAIINRKNSAAKRIGINTRYLQRRMSGIERYIVELINHLEKVDKTNTYFLFFNKNAPIPDLQKSKNFVNNVSLFPTKSRIMRIIWEHIFLIYEIKKNNLNLFHGPAFFVPLVKSNNCKYVITVHDVTFIKYPQTFTLGTRLYYTVLFPRSLHVSDAIIADSFSTKNDIIENYDIEEKKVKVISLGVSENFLRKREHEQTERVKREYQLPEKYFLFTGVLSPRKNVEIILSAFKKVKDQKQYNDYKLIIVGRKGWLYENIFRKAKDLNLKEEVRFIDHVLEEDLPVLYDLAQCYLFPSLYEGFGLPILEAMACGCPVITSNVSSMPEVAADAALLINPLNEDELVTAIKKINEDPACARNLREKGYEQVKKFSWEKTAQETLKVYQELLEEKYEEHASGK